MSLHRFSFGYCQHTSLMMRADKVDWIVAFNRPLPTGLIRFVQEDEP